MKAQITLTLNLDEEKVEAVKSALENIVGNCSQDDIILLGKLSTDILKRPIALSALRQQFN